MWNILKNNVHRRGDAFKKIIRHFLLWEVFCYCSYQHLAMIKLQKYLSMAFGGIGAPQKRKERLFLYKGIVVSICISLLLHH